MIVPKTLEPAWLDTLTALPHFVPGSADLVVISPHPDDETLGTGALIASHCGRGGRATIVAVTDGENAYENFPGLAAIRIREQEEAVQKLGGANAQLVRLNLTDNGVSAREDELTEALSPYINGATMSWLHGTETSIQTTKLVDAQRQPSAHKTGARLSWYFFWTWHRGTPVRRSFGQCRAGKCKGRDAREDGQTELRKVAVRNAHRTHSSRTLRVSSETFERHYGSVSKSGALHTAATICVAIIFVLSSIFMFNLLIGREK